jgi:hypothetical protein
MAICLREKPASRRFRRDSLLKHSEDTSVSGRSTFQQNRLAADAGSIRAASTSDRSAAGTAA